MSDVFYRFSNGKFDYKFMIEVEDDDGSITTISIRWAMCRRSDKPRNWSMSLLMHDIRFDGVDHEERVNDHRGHLCSGWHRHIWDSEVESCEKKKECLDDFGAFTSFREFLRDGCDLLKIVLEDEGVDDGEQSNLQFD